MSKTLKLKTATHWFKKANKDRIAAMLGNHPNALEQLEELLNLDLATWVSHCNALKSATARKEFIAPYKALFDVIEKRGRPGKAYHAWDEINGIIYPATQVIHGWLKNGHKYKTGELLPPATEAQLQALQDLFPKDYLPICLLQSYQIYGGIAQPNVRLWGCMSLAPIDLVTEQTKKRNAYQQKIKALPFGYDGAGNTWVVTLDGKKPAIAYVKDINHEEPNYSRSLDKRFCDIINKNHKLER